MAISVMLGRLFQEFVRTIMLQGESYNANYDRFVIMTSQLRNGKPE
jgi:hypothetical protein